MKRVKGPGEWPAPVAALALWSMFFLVIAGLGAGASDGTPQSEVFVRGVSWLVWRAVAAAAVVMFVVLLWFATRLLRHARRWGLTASVSRRRAYFGAAAFVVALAMVAQLRFGQSPQLPVSRLDLRTRCVLYAGLVTAVPWLTLVWLTHDECRRRSRHPTATATEPGLERLLRLWRLVVMCTGAFAVGVVAAIATSGALRAAFVSVHPSCADAFPPPATVPEGAICAESFPASNVLYYGAFFAVLLTMIAAPMGVAWRARAQELVGRMYPLPSDGRPTEAWVADRARLGKELHLDVSILRNPLTVLSIFTPLVTSTLAAFIPQLGQG